MRSLAEAVATVSSAVCFYGFLRTSRNVLASRFDMHGVYKDLGHQWRDAMNELGILDEGTRVKGNSARSSQR